MTPNSKQFKTKTKKKSKTEQSNELYILNILYVVI